MTSQPQNSISVRLQVMYATNVCMSNFSELGLSDRLLEQVTRVGFNQPTPIQEKTIPNALMNRDIVGIAQTGTGKTAAFVLPMLDILTHARQRAGMPRALVLNPTRELAMQTAEVVDTFALALGISHTLLIGGMTMGEQMRNLARAPDVIIATPGRLIDLQERGKILFNAISILVIDEADRMLDMGFIPDVEKICALLPIQRQTLMMSATIDSDVEKLAKRFTTRAKSIDLSPKQRSADTVQENFIAVPSEEKKIALVVEELKKRTSAIIFCNKRQRVREVAKLLKANHVQDIGQLHGEMSQPLRIAELNRFRNGEVRFLICSDVAARGLDIEAVDCVINFDVPLNKDNYVHRIGRTGRAGLKGTAITYVSNDDRILLERIGMLENTEKMIISSTKQNFVDKQHEKNKQRQEYSKGYGDRSRTRSYSQAHRKNHPSISGRANSDTHSLHRAKKPMNQVQNNITNKNSEQAKTAQSDVFPAFLRNPV